MSARHLDRDGVAARFPASGARAAPARFRALSGHCPHLTVPAALADVVVDTLERTPA